MSVWEPYELSRWQSDSRSRGLPQGNQKKTKSSSGRATLRSSGQCECAPRRSWATNLSSSYHIRHFKVLRMITRSAPVETHGSCYQQHDLHAKQFMGVPIIREPVGHLPDHQICKTQVSKRVFLITEPSISQRCFWIQSMRILTRTTLPPWKPM